MKALIIDKLHESIFSYLEKATISYDYLPDITPLEVEDVISDYEVLILRSKMNLTSQIISKATKLKIIGRVGAGLDNIDTAFAEQKSIKVIGANKGNMDAVAEHTLALILALLHNIVKSNLEIKDFIWDREGNRGEELSEKTVGIIGYGFMGKAVAQRLKPFGCKIIAYDKYLKGFLDKNVKEASMEEIFEQTDILTLHIPLTSETNHLVDSEYINKFKKQIRLINASRGNIVCLEDLICKIEQNKILGAGLDVLENEKIKLLTENEKECLIKLNSFDNVILTPHVAGWSVESYRKLSEVLGRAILKYLK